MAVVSFHNVQYFLLIAIAHHRAAARSAVGQNSDPVHIGGGAQDKDMPVFFHQFPGPLPQIKLGHSRALGPGEIGSLADQPVHLPHIVPQHR